MVFKKALFLIASENKAVPLISFAGIFKEKYKIEIDAALLR